MGRSIRTTQRSQRGIARWGLLSLALLCALGAAAPAAAFPEPPYLGPPEGFTAAESQYLRFFVEEGAPTDAAAFSLAYGEIGDRAHEEVRALLGTAPEGKLGIYVYATEQRFLDATANLTQPELLPLEAIGDSAGKRVHLFLPWLLTRSPLEAENLLRHAISHVLIGFASGDRLPRGFAEGLALYVERPVLARQARYAAFVQSAVQTGDLLSWSDLNRPQPPQADPELVAAHAYAIVAFLVDRHGLRTFRDFIAALPGEPDWRSAMRTVFKRSPTEIEDQWRENLPRWAAGGWRDNLFAAFDLQPARDSLAKAHYAAATELLQQSLRLYTELGDSERQAEVESLLRQGEIGLQAEALMTQTQESLERHTYDRAQTLVEQARGQYEQLPEEQRPTELLTTYAALARDGLAAGQSLDEASRLSRRWADYPEARAAALSAGRTFARLGDEEMRQQTESILADLDNRQRRLVLMLGALAALTIAWLALWLWARGPAELDWS